MHECGRRKGWTRTWRSAAAAALVLLLACAAEAAGPAPVQIITSPDRGNVQLDRQALLAIFLMRVRQWPDGTPVHVFVMPSHSAIHDRFAREQLGTYPYVLSRTWDRIVFTGTGLAPEVVNSDAEMRDKVANTPGAIGYRAAGPESDAATTRVAIGAPAPAAGSGAEHGTR